MYLGGCRQISCIILSAHGEGKAADLELLIWRCRRGVACGSTAGAAWYEARERSQKDRSRFRKPRERTLWFSNLIW